MVGTTTCDATDCEKTTDAIVKIVRPDWMLEQCGLDKETEVSLCGSHADGYGEGVSAEVELVAGRADI